VSIEGGLKTLSDYGLDGREALAGVIRQTAYRDLAQAVASLTIFSHPDTVAQTGARALFPIVRDARRRGETEEREGRIIGFDDNKAPTDAFLWANEIKRRPQDLQFNHVYALSDDVECYTNLANLCVSPAFLAKLTDTNPEITELLKFRVFDLYGWYPDGTRPPNQPDRYTKLEWSDTLPVIRGVGAVVSDQLARRSDRTARMISVTGWLLSES
tara:strand:+ start:15299 stop:15940 length:642 start_codon:yes stop_codon:yes gene_type:complete